MSDRDLWQDENIKGDPKEILSPDGDFKLILTSHSTGPNTWSCTKAKLYNKIGDEWVLMQTIKRNYSSFWSRWFTHKNGKRYLFCGQNYQGYTCIDLEENVLRDHLPAEAHFGVGFCWAKVIPNSDGTILAVDGCYWACPYEIKFYDFSDPGQWPLLEIGCMDFDEEKYGWEGEDFYVIVSRLFRKSDDLDVQRTYDFSLKDESGNKIISDDEYERLEEDASKEQLEAEYRHTRHKWEGPIFFKKYYEQTKEYIQRLKDSAAKDPEKHKGFNDSSLRNSLRRYWDLLTTEEKIGLTPPDEQA